MSSPITLKVLFFASAREAVGGTSSISLELTADGDAPLDTKLLR
jgi:hypothetical protein